ncbi:hypothetical protein GOE03_19535 [Sinorhizobium medicae]|nr:hypothetical protein [Sinorhizobium medicae]
MPQTQGLVWGAMPWVLTIIDKIQGKEAARAMKSCISLEFEANIAVSGKAAL